MMRHVFAVYDKAVQGFMDPFVLKTKGQAIRGFTDAVNESGHQMNQHPEDYHLYHLGEFNPQDGFITATVPDPVIGAIEVLSVGPVGERMRAVGDPDDG